MRAVLHASRLYTGAGLRVVDGIRPQDEHLGEVEDGALVYSANPNGVPGRVLFVGRTSEIPKKFLLALKKSSVRPLDLKLSQALIPGLVDCHNHLLFAGDRADEFALRCAGASYQDIAKNGGGIQKTVQSTRRASVDQLVSLGEARITELKKYGIRTLEIKSGYGLSHDSELRLLRAAKILARAHPELLIRRTYLGAHDFPKDQSRQSYLKEMIGRTLPEVAKMRLADSCDVFIDQGFYTLAEARKVLMAAKKLGLAIKVHADELGDTGSAAFAARIGALSADHLLKVSGPGIRALARSQTVAVLLPGTALYLKTAQAPAQKLIEAGVRVAIATDFNPGTCMTLNLPAVMTIAALQLGLSRAELFSSVTYTAARALGVHARRGSLEVGKDAAFAVLNGERFESLYYHFARDRA